MSSTNFSVFSGAPLVVAVSGAFAPVASAVGKVLYDFSPAFAEKSAEAIAKQLASPVPLPMQPQSPADSVTAVNIAANLKNPNGQGKHK